MQVAVPARAASSAQHLTLGLLLIVLLAACGRGPASLSPTSTVLLPAPAIPTPPPAGPLAWTARLPAVTAPAGPSQSPALAVAQSDGNFAYMCAPTGSSSPTSVSVWITRDRGATWTPTTAVTVDTGGSGSVMECSLFVDANQPSTVVVRAGLPTDGCLGCTRETPYVTTDFGAHWSSLHGPLGYPLALATRGALAYALFSSPPASASLGSFAFVKSTDGRRTWTTVDVPSVGGGGPFAGPNQEQVRAFWLNPIDGALLVMTSNSFFNDEHFWSSSDGTQWAQLSAPPFAFDFTDLVVQQPFTAAPWRICGGDKASYGVNGQNLNTHIDDIACTADSGAHWVTRTVDTSTYTLVAIADDSDLLYTDRSTLERFAFGSSGFESLGTVPNAGTLVYAASHGAGVLWAGPIDNYPNPDQQGRVYTASYA
jgi:hypothetical protein